MSFLPTRVDFGECRRQFIGFYGGAHVAAVNQISDARMQITVFEVLNTRNISWKGENILNLWYIYLESALAQMAMVPWINLEIDLREFEKKSSKFSMRRESVCVRSTHSILPYYFDQFYQTLLWNTPSVQRMPRSSWANINSTEQLSLESFCLQFSGGIEWPLLLAKNHAYSSLNIVGTETSLHHDNCHYLLKYVLKGLAQQY